MKTALKVILSISVGFIFVRLIQILISFLIEKNKDYFLIKEI